MLSFLDIIIWPTTIVVVVRMICVLWIQINSPVTPIKVTGKNDLNPYDAEICEAAVQFSLNSLSDFKTYLTKQGHPDTAILANEHTMTVLCQRFNEQSHFPD